jgi:hypothetical protein
MCRSSRGSFRAAPDGFCASSLSLVVSAQLQDLSGRVVIASERPNPHQNLCALVSRPPIPANGYPVPRWRFCVASRSSISPPLRCHRCSRDAILPQLLANTREVPAYPSAFGRSEPRPPQASPHPRPNVADTLARALNNCLSSSDISFRSVANTRNESGKRSCVR